MLPVPQSLARLGMCPRFHEAAPLSPIEPWGDKQKEHKKNGAMQKSSHNRTVLKIRFPTRSIRLHRVEVRQTDT